MKNKEWTLGFFGFLGFLAFPAITKGWSWDALYLLNFLWFVYFIPRKKKD